MSGVTASRISCITDDSIALLIDRFYAAIRRHAVLAPVFERAIAPDEWPRHLATMRRFWSSVMQASGAYSGNPVAVHRAVTGLERPMSGDLSQGLLEQVLVTSVGHWRGEALALVERVG